MEPDSVFFLAYITGMLFQRTSSQTLLSLNGNKVCFKVIKSKTYRPQRTEQLKCKAALLMPESSNDQVVTMTFSLPDCAQ